MGDSGNPRLRWLDPRSVLPARILGRKRPYSGLLAGMWELPGRPDRARRGARAEPLDLALDLVGRAPALETGAIALPPLHHAFSHLKVRHLSFIVPVSGVVPVSSGEGASVPTLRWVRRDEISELHLRPPSGS